MNYKRPLPEILSKGRPFWDCSDIRPVVRSEFDKTLKCGTAALGAEVYESDSDRKIVYHSCKSRICPSCGHRSTLQWQLNLTLLFPPYHTKGLSLRCAGILAYFRQNRHLLHDLPTIGAHVIQQWAKSRHGAGLIIVVVSHTFGRCLDFKCHLHILVSAGGLRQSQNRWIPSIYYPQDALMQAWRIAVVGYLLPAWPPTFWSRT